MNYYKATRTKHQADLETRKQHPWQDLQAPSWSLEAPTDPRLLVGTPMGTNHGPPFSSLADHSPTPAWEWLSWFFKT